MEPTLHNGEFIFVSKFSYNIRTPKSIPFLNVKVPYFDFKGLNRPRKGDIVLFKLPIFRRGKKQSIRQTIVKRIVGLPGDTMEINYASLSPKICFINDKKSYFNKSTIYLRVPKKGDTIKVTCLNNQFIEDMIRNEGHAIKVRKDGAFLIDDKPTRHYIVKKDYYYMRGDNSKFSIDSRNWGFLPYDKLIGKVIF